MSKCNIYSQNFESDINRSTMFVDISKLRRILSAYNPVLSGIWQPIVITPSNTNIDNVDPLVEAGLGQLDAFSPCNCQDSQIESLNAGFYQDSAASSLDCEYCGAHTAEWNLYDSDGNSSADFSVGAGGFSANCCNGACDVRMQNDDFITKVPLLHHGYISGPSFLAQKTSPREIYKSTLLIGRVSLVLLISKYLYHPIIPLV